MLRQPASRTIATRHIFVQILAACGAGLLLGISTVILPQFFSLGILISICSAYVVLKRPEVALLGILVTTSSIVFEDYLPVVSVGISLHIPDILLLGLLGLIAVRWMIESQFKLVRTPLDGWLFAFYGVMLLSALIAVLQSSVEVEPARRAIRVVSYYLSFFVVTNLIREYRQLKLLLNGLLGLAILVAAAMFGQFLLGDSVQILPGRVESLNTQGVAYEDITRILPPGVSILIVSFITLLCVMAFEKRRPAGLAFFIQFSLLASAILVTFLRSYWTALIVATLVLLWIVESSARRRLLGWSLIAVASTAVIIPLLYGYSDSRVNRLLNASFERFTTVIDSSTYSGQDGSLNWRMIENQHALSTIISNPLIGIGMGVNYRPWDPRIDVIIEGRDFRAFIHNGHLKIMLDSGLVGYICLMGLSFIFMKRGFKYWHSIPDDRLKAIVLGFTLSHLVILIAAFVNSTFTQWNWVPVIGMMMGINEVVYRMFDLDGNKLERTF